MRGLSTSTCAGRTQLTGRSGRRTKYQEQDKAVKYTTQGSRVRLAAHSPGPVVACELLSCVYGSGPLSYLYVRLFYKRPMHLVRPVVYPTLLQRRLCASNFG